jgi:hypothetical protein
MFAVRAGRDDSSTMKNKSQPRPSVTSASPQRDLVALSLLLRG